MISRRRFMQAGAATGVILAMPRWAYPFSQSVLGIKKFAVLLPGLVAQDANPATTRGIPLLTAVPTLINGVMTDVYEIEAAPFKQNLLGAASTLPAHEVPLWGYGLANHLQYLGGVIVAHGPAALGGKGTPVQLRVKNILPANHILPTDLTLIDPAVATDPGILRQDKIAIHLHGGFVFWQFDGGPFSWYTNPANPSQPAGVTGWQTGTSFIPAEQEFADGTAKYDYPNGQSARTIWYHDHAYGLTRTNVFAGLASAFLITDAEEAGLIASGTLPGGELPFNAFTELGIPLIVQDKTFWDGEKGHDPTYPAAVAPHPVEEGDLWYPHIYEGALDSALPTMTLPVPTPGNTNRWGSTNPAKSRSVMPSAVAEYFSDNILVNGAPYPVLHVEPRRYRFRFINASQARFYNLQLYVGEKGNPDGVTLTPVTTATTPPLNDLDVNGNVLLQPNPATNPAGPAFVQIATEAGFMKKPRVFNTSGVANLNSNLILRYKNSTDVATLRRRTDGRLNERSATNDPTFGNVKQQNLLMAPAERPDVIIDFAGFANEEIILYNDAPAPFPGGDIRNDYFVTTPPHLPANYNDHLNIGGAPSTVAGQGPDIRVLMKFIVDQPLTPPTLPGDKEPFDTWLTNTLTPELARVYDATQPPPNPAPTRAPIIKTLGEDNDEFGRLRQYLGNTSGNLRTYLDFPSDVAVAGEVQEWQIYNLTADTHPMHFHLVNVEVIRRELWDFNPADGSPILPLRPRSGSATPVDENEMSGNAWKDTVRMNPGEITTVRMKFDLPPSGGPPPPSPRLLATYGIKGSEYVWHCHILEHEEHDMMRPLVVIA